MARGGLLSAPQLHLQRSHGIPAAPSSFSQPLTLVARVEVLGSRAQPQPECYPEPPSHLPPSSSLTFRLELQEKRSTAPYSSPARPGGKASSS